MRAVLQRVTRAQVIVDGQPVAQIEAGLVVLLGIGPADTREQAAALARKIALLRIFSDQDGKINLSVLDTHGSAIVVSQFTLYADTRKGHRPSFTDAAAPDVAKQLCDYFTESLQAEGVPTQTGIFGAHMQVDLVNDGPVTIWLEG
jgi:D-tyrosyl-tRNA(Tyr) deacylase